MYPLISTVCETSCNRRFVRSEMTMFFRIVTVETQRVRKDEV